jgi:hypothetical protein
MDKDLFTELVVDEKLHRILGTYREKSSKVNHDTNYLIDNEYLN